MISDYIKSQVAPTGLIRYGYVSGYKQVAPDGACSKKKDATVFPDNSSWLHLSF